MLSWQTFCQEIPLNNFVRPGCTNQDQGNRLSWWGCIKTWTSWIYLCLLNSIKHPIFGFIYHLDGQRCSLKLKRSGYSKTWMTYIYICCLNTIKHHFLTARLRKQSKELLCRRTFFLQFAQIWEYFIIFGFRTSLDMFTCDS